MTWTYDGMPGSSTADERRDAVRLLIGDTDSTDEKLTDEEIAYALAQTSNETYTAAAICARAVAGKYANLTDTDFEGVSDKFSQRQAHYLKLATQLERQAKTYGSKGLGVPLVGGVTISGIKAADDLSDRVKPVFDRDEFENN